MDIKIDLDGTSLETACKSSWWYWFSKLEDNLAGCKNCDWVKNRGNAKSTSILRSHLKSHHPDLFAQKLEADQSSSKLKNTTTKRKAPKSSNSFEIAIKSSPSQVVESGNSYLVESPARSQASISDIHEYSSLSDTNEDKPPVYVQPSFNQEESSAFSNARINDMLQTLFNSNPNSLPLEEIIKVNNNTNNSTGQNLMNNELNEALPIVKLSRVEHFSAAHRLNNPKFDVQTNQQLFGKCNNPNGHGHNYKLKVVLEGPVNVDTGMVYNLSDLKNEMSQVLELVDHKNLDKDVAYFRDNNIVTTTENLAIFLFNELHARMSIPELLKKVVVDETDKNSFTYSG